MINFYRRITSLFMIIILLGMTAGCTPSGESAPAKSAAPFLSRFYASSFEGSEQPGGVFTDLSTAPDGYVGVAAESADKLLAQVCFGEVKYNYPLKTDGQPNYLPLQSGSGGYTLRVLKNTGGDRYAELTSEDFSAELTSEFVPFLHANTFVSFDENSACVAKASSIAADSADEAGFMSTVYDFIASGIKYDDELAATVGTGYVPDPDTTLASGKGICFDYASLAAAMLRSQGIPAKVVTGYVGDEALYHAWNTVYLTESGWITVDIAINKDNWTRIDLTFASTGAEDESLYVDRYVY